MKNEIKGLLYKSIIGLLVVLAIRCDTFQEDAIPPNKLVEFGQTQFYILPGTSAVIDIRSIVELTFTNGIMTISEMPSSGTLTELNPLTLLYNPGESFTTGTDQFEFLITESGKTVVNQTITISIISNEVSPCASFAVQDVETLSSDAPVKIKFMENDRLCGADIENIDATIYLPPKHGQATIEDDLIVYTSNSGASFDTIIYKVTLHDPTAGNTTKDLFGLIALSRSSCLSYLPLSVQLDLTEPDNSIATNGDCGNGFLIYDLNQNHDWLSCQDGKNFSIELIRQSKKSGNICYQSDGQFVFVNNSSFEAQNENADFEVCMDAQCIVLSLYVKRLKETWTRLPIVSNNQFSEDQANTIFFHDEQTGFVGGESIWKTVDGGVTWRQVFPWYTFGVTEVNDIHFIDKNIGFAAYQNSFDGGLLKTVDAGEHWTLLNSPMEVSSSVYFKSADIGFVGTGYGVNTIPGRIYKTIDGGANWTAVTQSYIGIQDIQFLDENVGFANAGRELLRTNNGGSAWQSTSISPISTDPNDGVMGLTHSGGQTYFILDNALWTWTDDGNFLLKRQSFIYSQYGAMSFSPSAELGIAVGTRQGDGTWRGDVLLSTDSGKTWSRIDLDPWEFRGLDLIDVSIPTENVAFALDHGGYVLRLDRK